MVLAGSYRQARAERARRVTKPRTSLLAHVGRALGKALPTWDAFRAFVLTAAGLGAADYGAFQLHYAAGWIAVGVSLLVLEFLTSGEGR